MTSTHLLCTTLRPVDLHVEVGADRVQLQLSGVDGKRDLNVVLGPAPRFLVDGEETEAWPLWHGVPLKPRGSRDPFLAATRWAHDALYPPRPFDHADDPDHDRTRDGGDDRNVARKWMRKVYGEVRLAAQAAADRCDPIARRAALKFPPHARWFVYRACLADPSGRVAQLAATCPGAVLFAFAFHEHKHARGATATADRIFSDAVSGTALNALLDRALGSWMHAIDAGEAVADAPEHPDDHDRIDGPWRRVRDASAGDREAIRLAQRLLLRRASASVAPTLLWLPPPLGFRPDDMPVGARRIARWFRVAKSASCVLVPGVIADPLAQESLARFVSRHVDEIASASTVREGGPRGLVRQLADYVTATGAAPTPRASAAPLIGTVRAWHRAMAGARALGYVNDRMTTHVTPTTALPGAPWAHWTNDAGEVRALKVVAEVLVEGAEMRHCVASRLPDILAARAWIGAATIGGARVTVELRQAADRWDIAQATGHGNRALSAAEWRVLASFVSCLNAPQNSCEQSSELTL